MPGRVRHCRCLYSSLLRPNGAANGRKDHRQQQALFILMAPAQQQARGNYSRPPRQKPQQGAQPAVETAAIKTIKRIITELDRSKIEEQKKAVRSGYDMDIIPSDLATYGKDAKSLLKELQSQNERMFMVTFLVLIHSIGMMAGRM